MDRRGDVCRSYHSPDPEGLTDISEKGKDTASVLRRRLLCPPSRDQYSGNLDVKRDHLIPSRI